jgi:hypothetical protein
MFVIHLCTKFHMSSSSGLFSPSDWKQKKISTRQSCCDHTLYIRMTLMRADVLKIEWRGFHLTSLSVCHIIITECRRVKSMSGVVSDVATLILSVVKIGLLLKRWKMWTYTIWWHDDTISLLSFVKIGKYGKKCLLRSYELKLLCCCSVEHCHIWLLVISFH